jgi:DNA polymerase-1
MKSLYLVDVSSMFFRAFYAIRPLSNTKGIPTNAVYGFLSMTVKLLKDVKPDYLVFCYDRPEPSFRKDLDPNYKANRTEMPEDLGLQIPYIRRLADALGICSFEKVGYEADDIIGTLAIWGARRDLEVVIVSGDKDFSQLVSPQITLYDTMKDQRLDAAGVQEKWGIPPERFRDFLAIVGDASDNIPGVNGIGLKGAAKLLQDYTSLEDIYAHLDQIKSAATVKKLTESKARAFLSRQLVTIVCDMDLQFNLERMHLQGINKDEIHTLLQELEFRTFERMLLSIEEATQNSQKNLATATPVAALITDSPVATPTMASPVGATAPSPAPASTLLVIADRPTRQVSLTEFSQALNVHEEVWALDTPGGVYYGVRGEVLAVQADRDEVARVLNERQVHWKGYDLKEFWSKLGLQDPHAAWDHLLAAYVLRAGAPGPFEKLYLEHVGGQVAELESPGQWLTAHLQLEKELTERLRPVGGLDVLQNIELPLIRVLYKMERSGVLLDLTILRDQSKALGIDLRDLEKKIYHEAGEEFNIGSPKQLGQILFEKLKMPRGRKIKTGYSTDTEVLEKLAEYPLPALVVEWRELSKLKSTYVDALPHLVDPHDGRIHTTFNQALTSTGRLSSTNPNLQNIPIRTPRGSAIRKAFIADPGCCLISADYSQIELRILAHIADDPGLKEAFAQDLDIHAATAARVFDISLEQVTPDLRRMAKAVNFGIAYGQGAFGLAETLGIGRDEATRIIAQYFARFTGVREYMDSTIEKAKQQGFVETLFGRRRYLDELKSKNPAIKKFGERAAINAPMQGTASDLVKLAMIRIDERLGGRMLLQVHDELIFEVEESRAQGLGEQIRHIMEHVVEWKVPLKVNVAIAANWGEAHA